MSRPRPLRPRTSSRTARGGFTFLELITATAIMAMLALALYTALRIGFKARDRALAAVGPARSAEIAMNIVRRELESALPPRGLLAGMFLGQEGTEVSGTSAVQFYSVFSAPPVIESANGSGGTGTGSMSRSGPSALDRQDPTAAGGTQRVELLVRPASAGAPADLVRRVTRNLLAPTEPIPDDEVICRGVTRFMVRYFDGLQWTTEWDSTQYGDALPMAVEVTLELTRPKDPTRAAADEYAGAVNEAPYRTTKTFFLPCRDEAALLTGGTQ